MREKISKICLSIGIIVIIISLFMINYIQYTNAKLVGCFIYFGFMMEIIAIILKLCNDRKKEKKCHKCC